MMTTPVGPAEHRPEGWAVAAPPARVGRRALGQAGWTGSSVITNYLLGHPWVAPAALVLLVVFGPFLGRWMVSRPRLAWLLTGVSLLAVAALTLVPVDRETFATCTVQWTLPTPARVELFANLVLFVPPTLLAGVALRRPAVVALAASGLSAAIEGVQAAAPAIGRSCDTTDWLCNTIGALVGALLAWVALRLARRRRAGDPADLSRGH